MPTRALSLLPALLIAALCLSGLWASACDGDSGRGAAPPAETPSPPAPLADGLPVVVSARIVCRLIADNRDADAAGIRGVDGAPSVVAAGKTFWFFGDTVRDGPAGRQDVIPASVATTTDTDASDCIDLRFKTSAGAAQPMFPRADETTAWPDGILPLDDGSINFYMVKAYRQSPFAWHVGAVGLGRLPAGSTTGQRVVERIWDEQSGFGAHVTGVRSPVRMDNDVLVYIRADTGANYVARAPIDAMDRPESYTYWDGAGWAPQPADAEPMWTTEETGLPADNGVYVRYDERARKWLAVYNGDLATVKVRTADQPWGPWSEPVKWIECQTLVGEGYPYCYSAELHPELARDGGALQYLTFSSHDPYDVTLLELRFGAAVHAWRDPAGALRYATHRPGDGYTDDGAAFYASETPAPGLTAIYERDDGGSYTWTTEAPTPDAPPTFYAHAAAPAGGAVRTIPVYRWSRDDARALDARERPGWTRGDVAFHVPCLTALAQNLDCGA